MDVHGGMNFHQATHELDDDSTFEEFYRNSVILITGGTGFLGKVLVEKLLRKFPIKRIYLLIRRKNNMTAQERLERLFQEELFIKLRGENPEFGEKVVPIAADYEAFDLDIAEEDKLTLVNEVEIVFNIVASVKFNEKLRDAMGINVLGTKKVLELSQQMQCLKSFLHISTLYSSCQRKYVGERCYSPKITYEQVIQIDRIADNDTFEAIQHCLIGEMPNTYTVTKRWAENLVNHVAYGMPAGIFRPPIVVSIYKDPLPGWMDNLNGPGIIVVGSVRGFIHCIYGDKLQKANIMPADYCINAMVVAAWDTHRRYRNRMVQQIELPVYNFIYEKNNLSWEKYMHLASKGLHEPLDKALWYYSYFIVKNRVLYKIGAFLLHTIPAYVLDFLLLIAGKKRTFIKAYRKIEIILEIMSYFGLRDWKFSNDNIRYMNQLISHRNRQHYSLDFEMEHINWDEYFRHYIPGIRKFHFREDPGNVRKARVHYKHLYVLHKLSKISFWSLILYLLVKQFSRAFEKLIVA
ncbi:fatty acyl-CoA reductase wat isoform X2 [Lutzomyia longipalpis]|uniref:fatty acyl-CoA reductase wat isoform X2 n=1 Tax=Lutzomyia longipalpis TaxID=7200 RepID=UPI002483BCD9|nr:fatty acyl-CoA reductase wat isoform X2 [Lutzomyia longipalpis]